MAIPRVGSTTTSASGAKGNPTVGFSRSVDTLTCFAPCHQRCLRGDRNIPQRSSAYWFFPRHLHYSCATRLDAWHLRERQWIQSRHFAQNDVRPLGEPISRGIRINYVETRRYPYRYQESKGRFRFARRKANPHSCVHRQCGRNLHPRTIRCTFSVATQVEPSGISAPPPALRPEQLFDHVIRHTPKQVNSI